MIPTKFKVIGYTLLILTVIILFEYQEIEKLDKKDQFIEEISSLETPQIKEIQLLHYNNNNNLRIKSKINNLEFFKFVVDCLDVQNEVNLNHPILADSYYLKVVTTDPSKSYLINFTRNTQDNSYYMYIKTYNYYLGIFDATVEYEELTKLLSGLNLID